MTSFSDNPTIPVGTYRLRSLNLVFLSVLECVETDLDAPVAKFINNY